MTVWQGSVLTKQPPPWKWAVGTTGKCVSVGCESGSERAAGPEEEEEEKGQNLKNVPVQKTPGG